MVLSGIHMNASMKGIPAGHAERSTVISNVSGFNVMADLCMLEVSIIYYMGDVLQVNCVHAYICFVQYSSTNCMCVSVCVLRGQVCVCVHCGYTTS